MSTTVQQILDLAEELLDDNSAEFATKAPSLCTIIQNELVSAGIGDLYAKYEVSNKPLTNLLGYISNFDTRAFEGTDLTFEGNGQCKAYYFEIDRPGTIYVEDYTGTWNALATITSTATGQFTAYKGVVTPTAGATKSRLRFSGSYYYLCINRALFNVAFASAGDVTIYAPWVKKTMPADFKSVTQIINEYPERQYTKDSNYKWESRNELYVNYYYDGKVRVEYKPVPITLTALTDTVQIDDLTATSVMPYGLAALLSTSSNKTVTNYFEDKYSEMKARAQLKQPLGESTIMDVYGASLGG
jgi:hypothetical protein